MASARGNTVEIVVKSRNQTRQGFAEAERDSKNLGKAMSTALAGGIAGVGAAIAGSGILSMAAPIGAAGVAIGAFAAIAAPSMDKIKKSAAVKDLVKSFNDMALSMRPLVLQVTSFAAKAGKDLLPALGALAKAGASILMGFLRPLQKLLASPLFDQFVASMVEFGAQAGKIIGPQLVKLLAILIKLFMQIMPSGVKVLQALLPALVTMVSQLAAVLAALAPLAAAMFGWLAKTKLLVPVLWALVAVITAVKLGFFATAIGAKVLAVSLRAIPFIAIATAIAVLVFLIIKYHKQIWAFVVKVWNDVYGFIKRIWGDILSFAKQWWPLIFGVGGLIFKYHNQIFAFIKRIWNDIFGFIKRIWNDILGAARNIWNNVADFFKNVGNRIWNGLKNIWNNIWDFLRRIWNNILGTARNIWNNVVDFFRAMGNRIWNGMKNIWNDIIGWWRNLPGRIINALTGLGTSLWNFGHMVLTKFWNGVKSVWNAVSGWFRGLPSKILHALGIKSPPDWAISAGKHIMNGLLKGLVHGGGSVKSYFLQMAGKKWPNLLTGSGAAYAKYSGPIGQGVGQWSSTVLKALRMEGLSTGLLGNVLYQMATESGGNPNIVNNWDSNAQAGTPSMGLMQVIGPTFSAYHWPGTSWNILNPLANIAAALNYARHVYGRTLMSGGMGIGSGHGYASGGIAGGLISVGEHGRELIKVPHGSMVYSNAQSRGLMTRGDGTVHVVFEWKPGSGSNQGFISWLKETIRVSYGGDVTRALGS